MRITKGHRVEVFAVGPKGFKYPHWINQSPGFQVLKGYYRFIHPLSGKVVRGNRDRIYGQSPTNWTWRGSPKFWDRSVDELLKRAKSVLVKQYKNNVIIRG